MDCTIYIIQTKENCSHHQSRERLTACGMHYMEKTGIHKPLPQLLYTEQGKPYFAGKPFHFSVSHSGDYWVGAFGWQPLGLDIQRIEDKGKWQALAQRFFHLQEAAYLMDKTQRDFYQVWCAKEAWVKYTGQGIGALKTVSVVDGQGMRGQIEGTPLVFPPPPIGYCMALCGSKGYQLEKLPDLQNT